MPIKQGLGSTVSAIMLQRMQDAAARAGAVGRAGVATQTELTEIVPTGRNPGSLRFFTTVPPGLPKGAPLVVALHGCTQNAASFDAGTGWSTLAQRHGFAVLLPEQVSANNVNTCFNWFVPGDTTRGAGEACSIAEAIEQVVGTRGLDPARVYITGLSAGGAMTSVLLATYPELFAGGGVIAGLPFGAAHNLTGALEAMRHMPHRSGTAWGDLVRAASPFTGRRPPVQLWHGSADTTVHPAAMDESVAQWRDALGAIGAPETDSVDGAAHQLWRAADGSVAVESFLVPAMGHGVPLHGTSPDLDRSVGVPGAYLLDAGIGSTRHMAHRWGLLTQAASRRPETARRRDREEPGGIVGAMLRRAGLPI